MYRCHMMHEATMEYLKAVVYTVGGILVRWRRRGRQRRGSAVLCAQRCR